MAKKKVAKVEEEQDDIRTTSTGQRYKCLSIPGLLDKARASVPVPEVPRYSYTTAGGDIAEDEMDDAVADDPKTSEEDKQRWAEYKAAEEEAGQQQFAKIVEVCYKRGIKLLDYEPEGEWLEEHRDWLGLDVPDKSYERRMYFIETEVVGSPEDVMDIVMGVALASGIDKEAVAAAEASFRSAIRGAQGDAASESAEEAGQVVGQG